MEKTMMEDQSAENQPEEREYRFRVESPLSKELITEGYRIATWHSWRVIVYALAILFFFGFAVKYAAEAGRLAAVGVKDAWSTYLPYIAAMSTLGILYVCLQVLSPGIYARRYIRQREAVHGDISAQKAIFFFGEHGFHSEGTSGTKIDMDYERIVSVYETEHAIVMMQKPQLIYPMDKSRIEGGSPEEFRAFLKEKMPWVKFHMKG